MTIAWALVTACAPAADLAMTGWIGCHRLEFRARKVVTSAEFRVGAPADYLAVTELFPDTPKKVTYAYRLYQGRRWIGERTHTGLGFGPTTFFVAFKTAKPCTIGIANLNSASPVHISTVRAVTRDQLRKLADSDRFYLTGLVPPHSPLEQQSSLVNLLNSSLPERTDFGIGRGFSYEVRYAANSQAEVRKQVEACAGWSRRHKMPALLGLVSWWSGTPLTISDGLGGHFGDLTYQQICYWPGAETPEDAALKALLGSRYDRHYGLSTPNIWSNMPWLTMNSKTLNDYRHRRLDEAAGLLKEASKDGVSWLAGIYLENEPRYWDTDCEAGNPNSPRKVLWADFNPLVVADAARDGVDLDPADGLSECELAWLHRNVGCYVQDTVDAARHAIASWSLPSELPVYTHSLQHRAMFPGAAISHPASEWAFARGARSGIQGLWSQISDFHRVREWGRWANVNREVNDGRDIDAHLWDLRVAYMMGADLYNSYNWHAIGPDRFFAYVREFLACLPAASAEPAAVERVGDSVVRIKAPLKCQAFTRIDLPVAALSKAGTQVCLIALGPEGEVRTSEVVPMSPNSRGLLAFEFAEPVEAPADEWITLRLAIAGPAGVSVAPRFDQALLRKVKLSLDLRLQRSLSLWAIANHTVR